MVIRFYWPECDFFDTGDHKLTVIWLECTEDEAQKEIFPSLRQTQVERVNEYLRDHCFALESKSRPLCFLVSKDLNSIETTPMHFPYANLWNGYSSFKELEHPVEITELSNIPGLSIPEKA